MGSGLVIDCNYAYSGPKPLRYSHKCSCTVILEQKMSECKSVPLINWGIVDCCTWLMMVHWLVCMLSI